MNADDLFELAEDPRFIEGIYNYCDRWCERCPFTSRCLNYAQLQMIEDRQGFDPTDHDAENARFWQTLEDSFQLTFELMQRTAAEQGIDIHSPEFQESLKEAGEENRQRFEAARSHYLSQAAERYGLIVERWFNRNEAVLHQRLQKAKTASGEIHPEQLLPEDVEDAIEIIRWYQFLPAAKLVSVLAVEKIEEIRERQQQHDNGRVKVALIGIDRSLLAWGRVQMFWPESAREIMRFAGLLSELRLELELEFPEARDFIRPGFDDASERVM